MSLEFSYNQLDCLQISVIEVMISRICEVFKILKLQCFEKKYFEFEISVKILKISFNIKSTSTSTAINQQKRMKKAFLKKWQYDEKTALSVKYLCKWGMKLFKY